uniref:Uncharacterized protein n=1 Tax=Populus trichocarpa TaxID=3694 RepID=B9NAG4_POPTR
MGIHYISGIASHIHYISDVQTILPLGHLYGNVQVEMPKHVDDEIIETIPYTGEYLVQGCYRVWIGVSRARGVKCVRCWNYTTQVCGASNTLWLLL